MNVPGRVMEWQRCRYPRRIELARRYATPRQGRLAAAAFLEHYSDKINHPALSTAIEILVRDIDGLADAKHIERAKGIVNTIDYVTDNPPTLHEDICHCVRVIAWHDRSDGPTRFPVLNDHQRHNSLLLDIIRNPFFGPSKIPAAISGEPIVLAESIMRSRRFDTMPILADALEDAGCDDEALLAHCRDPKLTHVRGCWAVDHVLGKS